MVKKLNLKVRQQNLPVIPSIDMMMEQRQKQSLYHMADESLSPEPKCWRTCLRNWPISSQYLVLGILFLLGYGILYSVSPELASISSPFLRIVLLFLGAQICGLALSLIKIPDLLGMILWGILFRNIGLGHFEGFEKVETFLRDLALANVLLLAGFALDYEELKDKAMPIAKLVLIPIIGEVGVIAFASHFLLEMPWVWCVMAGFLITAISPNVVVTVVLYLKEQSLGVHKGIHTMMIAMTTFNDIISIFAFSAILGIIFTTGDLTNQILQGPVGIGIGIVYGGVFGFFVTQLPSSKSRYKNNLRLILIIFGGLFVVTGSKAIGFPSAGALGCCVLTFVVRTSLRGTICSVDQKVENNLSLLWKFVKPISFAIIGNELDVSSLDNSVFYGIAIIVIGMVVRLIFAYLSTNGEDELVWRERAYLTISSLPKATIQATIGALALDRAIISKDPESISFGHHLLVLSVLSIIITAPLGALLMYKLSTKWLKKAPNIDDEHL